MNADRRKQIDAVVVTLNEALAAIETMREPIRVGYEALNAAVDGIPIEDIKNEEQEAFDNMSENLQQSDKGQVMEEFIASLETAEGAIVNDLYEIMGELENICDKMGDAVTEAIDALQSAKGD